MNKTAIKNFAVWARSKLIREITNKAGFLGISDKGIAEPLPQSSGNVQFFDIGTNQPVEVRDEAIEQRKALVAHIRSKNTEYKEAFQNVIEEVAYTWFNRLIAIRFMEVNDYLPSGVRVLSSVNPAKAEPDFVTTPFETDLDFSDEERKKVLELKDKNKLDELFRMLFIKQCNKLHEVLPELFEPTDDYTELLLNVSFTDSDGVVYHLVHDIEEEDFNIEREGQEEIIGWLYQYYNTEPKDETFKLLKRNIKISKARIPAATQLFTPDWIVRYMVQNSLGRLVISAQCLVGSEEELAKKFGWRFYLPEAGQSEEVKKQLHAAYTNIQIQDLKFIDPCMGSGHILVYAFDVFMQLYTAQGWSDRDAVRNIVENNLYGLEIDDRAKQLAYFAIMMKARRYDKRFLKRGIKPNVYSIKESNKINAEYIELFGDLQPLAQRLLDEFVDAKEYGSILNPNITPDELNMLYDRYNEIDNTVYGNFFDSAKQVGLRTEFLPFLNQARLLVQKYDVVCTNPPYMGSSGMDSDLSNYVKKYYPDSKSDLFAVFIEKCAKLAKTDGYYAMITQHSWMFLSSFEKLREKMLHKTTVNMAHLGARAFDEIGGEVVQTTAFVNLNSYIPSFQGIYVRLVDIVGENNKKEEFLSGKKRYKTNQNNFSKIPGSPIAYWVSENFIRAFNYTKIRSYCDVQEGLKTANNDRFIRYWYEVELNKTNILTKNAKWVKHTKGGNFNKWYGNNNEVLNFENHGYELKHYKGASLTGVDNYYKENITWNRITSGKTSFRFTPNGSIPNMAGLAIYPRKLTLYTIAFLNSKIADFMLNVINPTLNYPPGTIANLPIKIDIENELQIEKYAKENITLSKTDWDSFETSWDFKSHPLIKYSYRTDNRMIDSKTGKPIQTSLEWSYSMWEMGAENRFNKLKRNEEELNRIFIDIYGLQDELTPEVEDKDVTVRKADLKRDIKSFISYAVGCMFGRYSLDRNGIVFAGGNFNDTFIEDALYPSDTLYPSDNLFPKEPKYTKIKTDDGEIDLSFYPDYDNCIPITDEPYFRDDIVCLFEKFVETVYGSNTLEENLDFIAVALGNKGRTSREIIRNYFLNDFIKDHIKTYQKRPIYWMFDSGKHNGFKALVYMHRWNADTIGNMRVEYLHKAQRVYEKEIERMQEIVDNSKDNKEIASASKRKEKLQKQLKETKDYDAKVAHLALSRIDIDLDDGVKVNYEKVQTDRNGNKVQILVKM